MCPGVWPAMSESSLPNDTEAHHKLLDRLSGLTLVPKGLSTERPDEAAIAALFDRAFDLEPNTAGWEQISLQDKGDRIIARVKNGKEERTLLYGIGRWANVGEGLQETAGLAGWTPEGLLKLVQYEVRTPFSRTVTIRLTDGGVELHLKRNVSWEVGGWHHEDDTVPGTPSSSRP